MSYTYCGSVLLYTYTILYSSLYNWVKSTTIILLTLFFSRLNILVWVDIYLWVDIFGKRES